jgi:cytochrome c-type biogenesis protein CcmH
VVALLALASTAPALAHPDVTDDRSRVVSSRLLAPCCYQQTLDVHESPMATALRDEIRARLRAGETPAQVETSLVARYGERVRAVPQNHDPRDHVLVLVALAMVLGAVLLLRALRRWSRRVVVAPAVVTAPPRDAWDARLDDELRALDEA